MRTRGITWRLMALDLCWFTKASISLSSSCRNLENMQLRALGLAILHRPLSHALPPGASGAQALRGPLPERLYRQRHLCLLPAERRAIMAGLVEEQSPGFRPRALGWKSRRGGQGGRRMKGRGALTGCLPASPSGSRGRSGPITA